MRAILAAIVVVLAIFRRLFLVHPIDHELVDDAFRNWCHRMFIFNAANSATEGCAWAYVGYVVFEHNWWARPAAVVCGLLIAGVVWATDVEIASIDLKSKKHSRELLGEEIESSRRLTATFAARMVFMLISMTVTAWYISLIVLAPAIESEAAVERTLKLQQVRQSKYENPIAAAGAVIAAKDQEIADEIKGRNGRPATCGPVCHALQAERQRLIQNVKDLQDQEARFDALSRDPLANASAIAASYGVTFPALDLKERNRLLDKLRAEPGYRQTEWTARAWCILIFTVYLVSKLTQPASAELAFSQVLAPIVRQWRAGEFNDRVPVIYSSLARPVAMTLSWLYNFAKALREDSLAPLVAEAHGEAAMAEQALAAAESNRVSAAHNVNQAEAHVAALNSQLQGIDQHLSECAQARKGIGENPFSIQTVQTLSGLSALEQKALGERAELKRQSMLVEGVLVRARQELAGVEALAEEARRSAGEARQRYREMKDHLASRRHDEFLRRAGAAAARAVSSIPAHSPSVSTAKGIPVASLMGNALASLTSPLRSMAAAYLRTKLRTAGAVLVAAVGIVLITTLLAHSLWGILVR
jgi:hypothetical protein